MEEKGRHMNEVEVLSDNLTQLTTEIKTYQNIGGQAIFEIGRRLKWVKEHDLAHGEFGKWLEEVGINQYMASRFIKVAQEIPNLTTSSNIGFQALYEIATMPEDERDKPQQLSSGDVKKPDEMTVRELRETKARLKERDEQISSKDKTIASLINRQPEVVEKEVVVEKIPDDYDLIKGKYNNVEAMNKRYVDENIELREALEKRQRAMEQAPIDTTDSKTEIIKLEQQIKALHQVKNLDEKIQQFINEISAMKYGNDFSALASKKDTLYHIKSSLSALKQLADDIENGLPVDEVIEGEFNNE